ncbi:MAG: serine protease, partial [Gemmataceae bacterium]
MANIWHEFINDDSTPMSQPGRPDPFPSEGEALDAYSRVVMRVAETLRPAVVNLRSGSGRQQGSGSGVLFTPDGFLVTNHHVVRGSSSVRVRLTDG